MCFSLELAKGPEGTMDELRHALASPEGAADALADPITMAPATTDIAKKQTLGSFCPSGLLAGGVASQTR